MGEQEERQIWPVVLHDEKEVFQLFVIEGADDFQITDQGIELRQIPRMATVEARGDAPELLAAVEQGMKGFCHAIEYAARCNAVLHAHAILV